MRRAAQPHERAMSASAGRGDVGGRGPFCAWRVAAGAALALAFSAIAAPAEGAGQRFTLSETRTQAVSGPFTLADGARIRLGGTLYRITLDADGRVTFTPQGGGAAYGPYQPVAGRIMQIGDAMYAFGGRGASRAAEAARSNIAANGGAGRAAAPIATFEPMPPAPERIEVPPETPQRTVPTLDLPSLPDASRRPYTYFWLSPLDTTPLKWKVESVDGRKADFERTVVGLGGSFNSWLAEAAYTTEGKSGSVVPSGLGFTGASIKDATGFGLTLGYKRPFLREGGWTASAGILGRYRQEKGDFSSTALVSTGEADTNNVGNVLSSYETRTSSVKITEKALRLDFELAYRSGDFRGFAGVHIQPYSSVDVSGKLPYGDENLKVSAKHDDAIGAIVGGSLDLKADLVLFADVTLGYETRARVGLGKEW